MAQPPPRKGAYAKFVVNLHREQFNKLQAKNQQELDLLDDIRLGGPRSTLTVSASKFS